MQTDKSDKLKTNYVYRTTGTESQAHLLNKVIYSLVATGQLMQRSICFTVW
jgi:hypothetical protein